MKMEVIGMKIVVKDRIIEWCDLDVLGMKNVENMHQLMEKR